MVPKVLKIKMKNFSLGKNQKHFFKDINCIFTQYRKYVGILLELVKNMLRSLEGGHISIQTIMLNNNNQHTLSYVVNVSFKFGSVSIYLLYGIPYIYT